MAERQEIVPSAFSSNFLAEVIHDDWGVLIRLIGDNQPILSISFKNAARDMAIGWHILTIVSASVFIKNYA